MSQPSTCTICLSELNEQKKIGALECSHEFCFECIEVRRFSMLSELVHVMSCHQCFCCSKLFFFSSFFFFFSCWRFFL